MDRTSGDGHGAQASFTLEIRVRDTNPAGWKDADYGPFDALLDLFALAGCDDGQATPSASPGPGPYRFTHPRGATELTVTVA